MRVNEVKQPRALLVVYIVDNLRGNKLFWNDVSVGKPELLRHGLPWLPRALRAQPAATRDEEDVKQNLHGPIAPDRPIVRIYERRVLRLKGESPRVDAERIPCERAV